MTTAEAIRIIITDARRERGTKASYRRVKRALKVLNMKSYEELDVLTALDYVNSTTGKLYAYLEGEALP